MEFLNKKKTRILVSMFIFAIVSGSIVGLDYWENGEKARQVMNDLEREFATIEPLPQVTVVTQYSSYRPRQAWVVSKYLTDLNFTGIRAYYDMELAKRGWSFCEEKQLKSWGQDVGGLIVYYYKGDYTLSLEYAGEKPGYNWIYSLDLRWGQHNCS
jgi:hypothetical protein